MTGSSGGWQEANFDLSAYAGQQVEVSISYVTDPSSGGIGVVVDDTALVVGGGTETETEGFETGLGAWSVPGPPSGSPSVGVDFVRSQALLAGAVTTEDSVLLGFGLEQIASATERAAVVRSGDAAPAGRRLVPGDGGPPVATPIASAETADRLPISARDHAVCRQFS